MTRFGGALRLEYRGNWKMFMENAVDLVHPGYVHRSSVEAAKAHPEALQADAITQQGAHRLPNVIIELVDANGTIAAHRTTWPSRIRAAASVV